MASKPNVKKTFKVKKAVKNAGLIQIKELEPVYVTPTGPMEIGEFKGDPCVFLSVNHHENADAEFKPAKMMVPAVLHGLLRENYPNDSYIGVSFEVIKGEKVKGQKRQYSSFELNEIEFEG